MANIILANPRLLYHSSVYDVIVDGKMLLKEKDYDYCRNFIFNFLDDNDFYIEQDNPWKGCLVSELRKQEKEREREKLISNLRSEIMGQLITKLKFNMPDFYFKEQLRHMKSRYNLYDLDSVVLELIKQCNREIAINTLIDV